MVWEKVMKKPKVYWTGTVGKYDDFGIPIQGEFIDGMIKDGRWAIMTPQSWEQRGIGTLGLGKGQRYRRQVRGDWLKVEG